MTSYNYTLHLNNSSNTMSSSQKETAPAAEQANIPPQSLINQTMVDNSSVGLDLSNALVTEQTPIGLTDVSNNEIKPHPQSRTFMDRVKQFGVDAVAGAYKMGLSLSWKGAIFGGIAGLIAAGPMGLLAGAAMGTLNASLAGGVIGGTMSSLKNLFGENKNEIGIPLKERIKATNDATIIGSLFKKKNPGTP